MSRAPGFSSLALREIPAPDYADVVIGVLPEGAPVDPRVWAETLFSARSMPWWVVLAMGVRQLVVPLIGVRRAERGTFAVKLVEGDEALMGVDERHLDFRCAVGVDAEARLVRVTTTVRLKGWRGRLYFGPVGLAHPVVVQSMLRKAQKRLAG